MSALFWIPAEQIPACEQEADSAFGTLQSLPRTEFARSREVPAAQREPILRTHCWADNDLRREAQVFDHAPDDHRLLRVLLPEICAVRREDIEQFCHDRCHAPKVPGAPLTLPLYHVTNTKL